MKTTSDEREYLSKTILAVVNGYYDVYRKSGDSRAKEPSISVGVLFNEFNENRGWGPLMAPKDIDPKFQYYTKAKHAANLRRLIWSAAEGLRAKGLLGSSTGEGVNGREARCYEPAPEVKP
jgi:hypothetical protein